MSLSLPNIARPAPGSIHCWWLPYQRSEGRAPLLGLLARYLQVEPGLIELAAGPHGRPTLAGALAGQLDFNWSHSGQHAAIAIAIDVQVGIDIESHHRRPSMLELAHRYFSASESQAMAQMEPPALESTFWALWTGKEAVLKAIGSGISYGLHRVSFEAAHAGWPLASIDGSPAAEWQLVRPQLEPGYSAALAWQGQPAEVIIHRPEA